MTRGHALVCAPLMPEFDRESGSRRIYDLIEMLRLGGWSVTFAAQRASADERYARMLQQRGVAVYIGFDADLERLIASAPLDVAILAFWQVAETVMPMLRTHSPSTRALVDSIDLHFLRSARGVFQGLSGAVRPRLLDSRFAAEMTRELNAYAAADGVLAVSQKEADWINDLSGDGGLAHVVPDAEELPLSTEPLAARRGILFLGNFQHAPNVGAAEYLCKEIVPRVDADLLARHPLSIVGHALDDKVRGFGDGLAHVNMIGWVPTVLPYLNRARTMAVPLLYGAGTKRKLLQALMTGLPSVSTSVGAEGLDVRDGEHLLVADDPSEFARAIERVLTDDALCTRLISQGRAHVVAAHGRDTARKALDEALARVSRRAPKPLMRLETTEAGDKKGVYRQIVERVREAVQKVVPAGARILVTSRGDDQLLELEGRRADHFPQAAAGVYAGHHPADSAEAIGHLEKLRAAGAEYLLFPATAFWWLEHYADLRSHLETTSEQVHKDAHCAIYRLDKQSPRKLPADETVAVREPAIARLRPVIHPLALAASGSYRMARQRVLLCGIYLAAQENTVDDVVNVVRHSKRHDVTQRWVALGGSPPNERVAAVTAREIRDRVPKFKILNDLLAAEDLAAYDYILLADDDVVLPDDFLDEYIDLQAHLDFAIAQPARTSNSYIDHPIVEQQQGVLARRTRFVEIGPVVSFHKSCFDLVFPFDLTAPMGWGYENIWALGIARRGAKMGILDAVPVDHSTRTPVANYSWAEADRQRKALLARREHLPLDECFRVLEAIGFDRGPERNGQ